MQKKSPIFLLFVVLNHPLELVPYLLKEQCRFALSVTNQFLKNNKCLEVNHQECLVVLRVDFKEVFLVVYMVVGWEVS